MKNFLKYSTGNIFIFKLNVYLLLLLTCIQPTMAEYNSSKDPFQIATEFFKTKTVQYSGINKIKEISSTLTCKYESPSTAVSPVFVYENENGGFVVLSKNLNIWKIVGYSQTGGFNRSAIPTALNSLIESYEQSTTSYPNKALNINDIEIKVDPLLTAAGIGLDQFRHADVGGCPTGCVATAITQIMLFHKFPQHGIGSNCYTHTKYGEICADFQNTTYNWTNMTTSDYEKLSFHVGVAMNMNYCGDASGSIPGTWDYLNALKDHFNYHTISAPNRTDYIITELDNGRPVYIELPGKPGHALVVDGYDNNGFFHLNFGWGGKSNGYFLLNNSSSIHADNYDFGTNISKTLFISPTLYNTNINDSLALVAFHNGMKGSTGWDLSKPVSEWKGVLVINNRVLELEFLYENDILVGSIPPEIESLTALRRLQIKGLFSGTLPSGISKLTNLEVLSIESIHQSTMKGSLSDDIGNLNKLQMLSINNALEGTLPASLSQLVNLSYLNIPVGNLTGEIPVGLTNLTKLTELNISNHKLSGNIPQNIGLLIKLTKLDLSGNHLSGKIPESIGSLTELSELYLNNNLLTENIPTEIVNLFQLKNLDVSNNNFTKLCDEIGNCEKLETLILNTNKFNTFPVSINNLSNLKILSAANNSIYTLDKDFGSLINVTEVDLSNNELTAFPSAFCSLVQLTHLYLHNNKIQDLPVTSEYFSPLIQTLTLENNEMQGVIPASLLESEMLTLNLEKNRFRFEDIPASTKLKHKVGQQKTVSLSNNTIKVMMGDTVKIDIRKISALSHPENEYYWCNYPMYINTTGEDYVSPHVPQNPELNIIINEKTINKKYYCKVFNSKTSTYTYSNGVSYPCINYLNTDTISFQLVSEDEMYAEKNPDNFVVSSATLIKKEVEDKIVTLVPTMKIRGTLQWQASADKITWFELSPTMTRADLKANFVSLSKDKLVLSPITPAYYRTALIDASCDPLYSDTIKVNPYGVVLYDSVKNVVTEAKTIITDSIEVTIPENFYDKDFRVTIVKVDNPPPAPEGYKLGTVYDVNVSFGDEFDAPLLIKLKNINKAELNDPVFSNYKPVYFDDVQQKWVEYENGGIALTDSCILFYTNHLTKLSFWNPEERLWGYTDVYERNNIRVVWAQNEESEMKYVQTPQPWHVDGTPLICQDITQFLSEIRTKLKTLNLYDSDKPVTVYLKKMEDDGNVGLYAMLNHYISINRDTKDPILLRSLLAHEYMHLVQSHYIIPSQGNVFWIEANAHLTDRMVWNENVISKSQSEEYLTDITGFLSTSWDYWDKTTLGQKFYGDINKCYPAGTFIHYMRSYRTGEKLKPEVLLRETPGFGSWRNYLDSYIQKYLKSNIEDEYESFIKYILKTDNKNFSLHSINEKGFSYTNFKGKVDSLKNFVYNFKDTITSKPEKISLQLPYLSTRIYFLNNLSLNYNVVVNYKSNHSWNPYLRVFYGKYNFERKNIDLIDITDSINASFFLESFKSEKLNKNNQNAGFLVLINKNSPQSKYSAQELDASFEITATPVLDFADLVYATIAPDNITKPIHLHNNGAKDYVYIAGEIDNLMHYNNKTYTNVKKLIGDSVVLISSTFKRVTVSENGFNLPNSIDDTEKTQTVKYNFIKGDFDIQQSERKTLTLDEYHDEITDKDIPARLYSINEKTTLFKIKGVFGFEKVPEKNQVFFRSDGSTHTQEMVEMISNEIVETLYNTNGTTTVKTKRYESTDYSSDEIYVYLWLQL